MAAAVLSTRDRKRTFPHDELMVSWLQRGDSLGFGPKEVLWIRGQRENQVLTRSTVLEGFGDPPDIAMPRPPLILQQDRRGDRCNIKPQTG